MYTWAFQSINPLTDLFFVRFVVHQEELDEVGERSVLVLHLLVVARLRHGAVVDHDDLIALGQKAQRISHENSCLASRRRFFD